MRRIGISLPGMHRRIETNFKETLVTQPETQKPASCKSGSGLPGTSSANLSSGFSPAQQISRETNDRQYRKQFGKVRGHSSNINEDSDQPARASCCGIFLL